jgi:hypothetical protein
MIGIGPNLSCQPSQYVHRYGASLAYDFALGTITPTEGSEAITFTRSTTKMTTNALGLLASSAINQPGFEYDPLTPYSQNLLLYSEQFYNAAWTKNGVTISADAAIGPSGGITADKCVEDGSTGFHKMYQSVVLAAASQYSDTIVAKAGERTKIEMIAEDTGASAALFDLSAGTVSAPQSPGVTNVSASSTITYIGNGYYACTIPRTTAGTAADFQIRLSNGSTTSYAGDGASGIYLGRAQLNAGATALAYAPTTSVAAPVTYACKGFLIEEQRTNVVRNNTMAGASAGTPGTDPTNWSITGATSGITKAIVGVGTESGVDYIDVSFTGTASSAVNFFINTDGATSQAASSGQAWTASAYIRKISGNSPSATFLMASSGRTSGGGANESNTVALTPTNAGLINQRSSVTANLVNASTAFILQYIQCGFASGEVANLVLRIGLPQLELGPKASSPIRTTSAQVTRAADIPTVGNVTPWFNTMEGTFVAQFDPGVTTGQFSTAFVIDDGTANNIIRAIRNTSSSQKFGVTAGGVAQANIGLNTITTTTKLAAVYKVNDISAAEDGVLGTPDTVATIPSGLTTLRLGHDLGPANSLNGVLASFQYYPFRRPPADLTSIST